MTEVQYFECENCGQVVQGWGASRDIECCERPDYVEIEGPDTQHLLKDLVPGSEAPKTKSGNYRK